MTFKYRLVVYVHKGFLVFCAAVAHSHGESVSPLLGEKCLSIGGRKLRATFVTTLLLKGGLYQITLRCLLRLVVLEGVVRMLT